MPPRKATATSRAQNAKGEPTGVEPGGDTPPDVPTPEGEPAAAVEGEAEPQVDADGNAILPPGAVPYQIDGRVVTQHEYAEWANEQAHDQALADLQAAAEGRGETPTQPPEES